MERRIVNRRPYVQASHHFALILLATLLLTSHQITAPAQGPAEEAYLARQATALRPPFQHHLETLSDIPFYHIDAQVDLRAAQVKGELDLRYTNRAERALSELAFRLLPNAQTIYGGGKLAVTSVLWEEKELDVSLSPERTTLRVPLTPTLAPGRSLSLTLQFTTDLPLNRQQGYGLLHHSARVTSLAGWYPILSPYQDGEQMPDVPRVGDAMVAETSLYRVTLQIPRGAQVASTGELIRVQSRGDETEWHWVSGPAREFSLAISQDFQQYQTQVDGVNVRFYSLPSSQPNISPQEALQTITSTFQVFTEQFGPYPYTEFDVVEVPITIGGYEFPGMVYVDDRLRARGEWVDYRYIVAHEVAHQWWYGLVGNNSIKEPWLDESLASYSAAIYLEKAKGENEKDGLLGYWRRTYGQRRPYDPPINSSALDFSSWLAYRAPVYYQGALFLDSLRQKMGDDLFFSLLKRYQTSFRYQQATTRDFLGLVETVYGSDLDTFFSQWFEYEGEIGSDAGSAWSQSTPSPE